MDAREALDILDLTLLDLNASESELDELCRLANLHRPASVCVFSEHVSYVVERFLLDFRVCTGYISVIILL